MSTDPTGINSLMSQVARLFRELQTLLVSADDLMAAKSWSADGNTCNTGSNSISRPTKWLPTEVHRFYLTKNSPTVLCYIAAMLYPAEKRSLLPQPLLTAGWIKYPTSQIQYKYWYCLFHTWMPGRDDQGRMCHA